MGVPIRGAAAMGTRARLAIAAVVALAVAAVGFGVVPDVLPGSQAPAETPAPCPAAANPVDVDSAPPAGALVELDCIAAIPRALQVTPAPDGTGRLLVTSQNGQVWSVRDGLRSEQPVLDLSGRVSLGQERGLLGLAIDPRFPVDPRIFVDFSDTDGTLEIASFELGPGEPEQVRAGSEQVILRIPHPQPIHNGGSLAFGPDGDLYIGVGDDGLDPDLQQEPGGLLGRILRIDVDDPPAGEPYAIPVGNPYAAPGEGPTAQGGGSSSPTASAAPIGVPDEVPSDAATGGQGSPVAPETWLTGFRNPWRFSFDQATGDLWIGDVGANTWEEVDVARAGVSGLDFGWPIMEGFHCYVGTACAEEALTLPVAEYPHGPDCALMGGYVYRGAAIPALAGDYLFGDYCSGRIYAIPADDGSVRQEPRIVGESPGGVAGFGEAADGELYVANVNDGAISRLVPIP